MGERIVDLVVDAGLVVSGEAPVADVADYSDDRDRVGAEVWRIEPATDDVRCAECAAGKIFVDDDDGGATEFVVVGEEASGSERDLRDGEIAGTDG